MEEVFVAHLDGTGRRRLSFSNSALAEVALGKVETIGWKRGPETLEGILVWPPTAVAEKRLPMVTLLHGGPGYNWGLGVQIQQWAQPFAAEGYLVFLPNFRGSTGYGFDWMSANVRDWGEGPMNDVLSGVEHLVAKGWADPARLFLGGRSYGGYLTAWMITHTDLFKAAFDAAGLSELVTAFGTTDEPSFFQGYFRATPYQDPEIYRAHSPLTFASRARTLTLLLHGERDLRCPLFQAQVFYAALKHHGVACELVVYPREGHGFTEYPHQIDAMRRVLAWFRKHDPRKP